jgi:hypothetical protein
MGGHAAGARRRGRNEGSIYTDEAKGRWYGAVSLGYGPDGKTWRRHKVSGRTRAEVAEKLKQLQAEQDSGVQPERAYTVQRAVDDWLAEGLDGRSARTVRLNHDMLQAVTAVIGGIELRALTAHDVRRALVHLAASRSSRTVVIAHNALTRALRHAEANRHVMHNVAALVDTPKGQSGRPSKALTAEQAAAVLKAAESSRLRAYLVLCLMTGIRTEEALWGARSLRVLTCSDEAMTRPAVGHHDHLCPCACSISSSSGSAAGWSCPVVHRRPRTRSCWCCGTRSPCCAVPIRGPGSTGPTAQSSLR